MVHSWPLLDIALLYNILSPRCILFHTFVGNLLRWQNFLHLKCICCCGIRPVKGVSFKCWLLMGGCFGWTWGHLSTCFSSNSLSWLSQFISLLCIRERQNVPILAFYEKLHSFLKSFLQIIKGWRVYQNIIEIATWKNWIRSSCCNLLSSVKCVTEQLYNEVLWCCRDASWPTNLFSKCKKNVGTDLNKCQILILMFVENENPYAKMIISTYWESCYNSNITFFVFTIINNLKIHVLCKTDNS